MPSAFQEEEAGLLGAIANQIALVIANISTREPAGLNAPSSRQSSLRSAQPRPGQGQGGYTFNIDGTITTTPAMNDAAVEKAISSGEIVVVEQPVNSAFPTLTVPVKFRDQVIGVIHVESTEQSRNWTDDEITVVQSISDRAAFALENARLLEEANRRAKQEEAIAHITSQIGSSTNFDHILQTTVEELGRTLGATRAFIQLEALAGDDLPAHSFEAD
jgi:GAF domain-containing protein